MVMSEIKKRNQEIYKRILLFRANRPEKIARDYDISKARLFQIIAEVEKEDLTFSLEYAKMKSQSKNGGKK